MKSGAGYVLLSEHSSQCPHGVGIKTEMLFIVLENQAESLNMLLKSLTPCN